MRYLIVLCLLILVGCSTTTKMKGTLISDKSHIDEIASVSTAFAYVPTSLTDIEEVLAYNKGRLIPFIELSRMFWDESSSKFVVKDTELLNNILHKEKIVILLDEPLWRIRRACEAGNASACIEIDNKFINTQQVFSKVKSILNKDIVHIEAYLELIKQKEQFNRIYMIEAANHVGFDCYGKLKDCNGHSQYEYLSWIYNYTKGTDKKVFLTVGAWEFAPIEDVITQIHQYFDIYRSNSVLFSGIGVFTWGDYDGIKGARNIPELSTVVKQELYDNK